MAFQLVEHTRPTLRSMRSKEQPEELRDKTGALEARKYLPR